MIAILIIMLLFAGRAVAKEKQPEPSPLDRYLMEATRSEQSDSGTPTGSLYRPGARLADLGRDLRASQVHDLVTIVVAERASAVAKGTTSASRASSAKSSIGALAGPTKAGGRLSDLVSLGSDWKVEGEGQTSRETLVTTTLSARVTQALPNGALAIEGSKEISVNSERQLISIRGIIRPNDLTAGNLVRSDRIAFLEVRINGKGVVGDAVRRPNFLYRLLLGLLPF